MTDEGMWRAFIRADAVNDMKTEDIGQSICPMSGGTLDETAIATDLFPDLPYDDQIGRYRRNVAGYVVPEPYRKLGGSGGLTTWLLSELMRRHEVDAVIHVRPREGQQDGILFEYTVSKTREDVLGAAKSRYYPIEMSEILRVVSQSDLRFAFVGLPCFVKTIRLLQREGDIPEGRIRYCIGLVCGHLKSRHFAEYLGWQKGIEPDSLDSIDFRHKLENRPASNYGFAVSRRNDSKEFIFPMDTVRGRDWGEGLFKNPACEFCDDVLAETADLAVGDAWLPEYVGDPKGTNVAVVRSEGVDRIINEGIASGELYVDDISVSEIIKSQSSGLRHRREGLSHRLARRIEEGRWVPQKRVQPALAVSAKRRSIYDLRLKISEESSKVFVEAKRANDLNHFEKKMSPILKKYHREVKGGVVRRGFKKIMRILKSKIFS